MRSTHVAYLMPAQSCLHHHTMHLPLTLLCMAATQLAPAAMSGAVAAMLVACSFTGELLVHTHTAQLLHHLRHTPHFSSIATHDRPTGVQVKVMSFLVHVPLSMLLLWRMQLNFGSIQHDTAIIAACGASYYMLVLTGLGCNYGLPTIQLCAYGAMWVVAATLVRGLMYHNASSSVLVKNE